jgi:predicted dehydrogenase
MRKLRAAVVGVGYLGNFHAQKYTICSGVQLVGVADTDRIRGQDVATKHATSFYSDYRALVSEIDIVSIVVPPVQHYAVAEYFLSAGVHALVEKPLTETVAQAEKLISLASRKNLILQVGHLERFNPVILLMRKHIVRPERIEAKRLASYKERGTEVDVVLDLMIHDIDIVLSLTNSSVTKIYAEGAVVRSGKLDMARASIEFTDGLVANLEASRVSDEPGRSMDVYEGNRYLSLDYVNHELKTGRVVDNEKREDIREFTFESEVTLGIDILRAEIQSFVTSASTGTPPKVSGVDGKKALEVAIEISHQINGRLCTEFSH